MGLVATKKIIYRGVPKELVLLLKDKYNVESFIETGTFAGETALWAAEHFKHVYTFEAAQELHEKFTAKELPQNLQAVYGDSSSLIGNYINNHAVYYLDAHYSSGNTFNSYPLLDEVRAINQKKFDDFIIIDDARFVLSMWNNERYCTFADLLTQLAHKDRYTVVFDDMIISVPAYAATLIDEYTNTASKVYWNAFVKGEPLTVVQKLKKLIPAPVKQVIKKLFFNRG